MKLFHILTKIRTSDYNLHLFAKYWWHSYTLCKHCHNLAIYHRNTNCYLSSINAQNFCFKPIETKETK